MSSTSSMHRKHLHLFLLLTSLTLQLACTGGDKQKHYKNQGFSIAPAPSWVLSQDNKNSLFGEREIIFKLSEISFTSFYINDKSVNFNDFIDDYIHKTLPQTNENNIDIQKEMFTTQLYQGVKYKITSHFMGEEKTYFYAIEIPCGDKKIFNISLLAEELAINSESNLKNAIKTLKFTY